MTRSNRLPIVVESFRRCRASGRFLEHFYQLFVDSSPQVAEKFKDTDFARQREMLQESLHTMLAGVDIPETGLIRAHLERVARRHSRADLDIPPALYDVWLDCLVQAVRILDPEYSADVDLAWREAMAPGIAFLRSRYE